MGKAEIRGRLYQPFLYEKNIKAAGKGIMESPALLFCVLIIVGGIRQITFVCKMLCPKVFGKSKK